jgi:hypothetical protein
MKNTITFKGFYFGEDKPTIKKGDRIYLKFHKKDLIEEYRYYRDLSILADRPYMSLFIYVKRKVHGIYLRGSLYN